MQNRPSRISLGAWAVSTLMLTLLVALCVRYLDEPLAYYIKNHLFTDLHWSHLSANLPDLLLQVVLLTTCAAQVLYRARLRMGLRDAITHLSRLVAWAAPASYLVKSLLKYVFGRVNTRYWLEQPELYGLHWFQQREGCEGFPSGHMVVIVTLLAALWRFYPRLRPWCLLLGVLLGMALVATDYHFLSDVLAGAYLGVVIEALFFWLLVRGPQRPDNPAY